MRDIHRRRPSIGLIGFMAMAFAVLGLAGVMASVIAPVPLARAVARDAALDEALAATTTANPQAALETLRSRLGDSAPALLPFGPDLASRVAVERNAMRARLMAEAAEVGHRLRWLIAVLTLVAAGFGTMLLQAARNAG